MKSAKQQTFTIAAALSLLGSSVLDIVNAQENGPAEPWLGVGSASFYWHNRYHGCLAMAVYGDYNNTCPQLFTAASLERQYPGNTEQPFQYLGKWGPTPKYKSEGIMLRVPEMHKVLAVFKGVYGWENFNATLSPLLNAGCNDTCMAHTGAIEAWAEVKEETDDFRTIREHIGDLTWSMSGHGFGGMIAQVASLDLHTRSQYAAYSCHTFGSPPVFNLAASRRWDQLYYGDSSQRTVANFDSVPASIPYNGKPLENGTLSDSEYVFVNTGIHVWTNSSVRESPMGSANMYGQNYDVCVGYRQDPRCTGGDNPADHLFYYGDIGSCCEEGWETQYDGQHNRDVLQSQASAYNLTATAPLLATPITEVPTPTTTVETTTTSSTTSTTETPTTSAEPIGAGNDQDTASTTSANPGSGSAVLGSSPANILGIFALLGLVAANL